MLKNVSLIVFLFFSFLFIYNKTFAYTTGINKSNQIYFNEGENFSEYYVGILADNNSIGSTNEEAAKKNDTECSSGSKLGKCIDKSNFIISVNDISPGMKVEANKTTAENVNFALGTIIQKLMIGLGSFAMIIMTIGAGYIILYSGQDEILSKGKNIFMSGVYALIVALGSYYLIVIFRHILFN